MEWSRLIEEAGTEVGGLIVVLDSVLAGKQLRDIASLFYDVLTSASLRSTPMLVLANKQVWRKLRWTPADYSRTYSRRRARRRLRRRWSASSIPSARRARSSVHRLGVPSPQRSGQLDGIDDKGAPKQTVLLAPDACITACCYGKVTRCAGPGLQLRSGQRQLCQLHLQAAGARVRSPHSRSRFQIADINSTTAVSANLGLVKDWIKAALA